MHLPSLMMRLCRAEILGETVDVAGTLSEDALTALYRYSKSLDVAHIVGSALERLGLLPEGELAEKFRKQTFTAVFRYERMNYEYEQICRTLEAAEIDFMPLKGSLIRAYYPDPWMRTSCDVDILVHEEELDRAVEALVSALGYSADEKREFHDVSLHAPGGMHLELHFSLLEGVEKLDRMLSKVWEYALPVEGWKHRYTQTNEYLLFHMLAHMSYHFIHGGCGVRPLIDLQLLVERMPFDEEILRRLCRECSIETFYEQSLRLCRVWFFDAEQDETTKKMEQFLFTGGVYGNKTNQVAVQQGRRGRLGFLMFRIFMPREKLQNLYPVLKKHPYLLPFCWVRRWFRLLKKGTMRSSLNELKTSGQLSREDADSVDGLLRDLGL